MIGQNQRHAIWVSEKDKNTTQWQFWGGNDDKSWDLGVPDETRGVNMITPMGFRNRLIQRKKYKTCEL